MTPLDAITHAIISPMDEGKLTDWLDSLVKQGLIHDWHWTLNVEPGEPTNVRYIINGKPTLTREPSSW
jgi:hypothetical protein